SPLPASRLDGLKRRSRGQQAMTAHPHVDELRNRLVSWTWGMQANASKPNTLLIELCEYDNRWTLVSQRSYQMPGAAVNPHDFAFTQNYYVFFENALRFDVAPFLLGIKSPADCLKLMAKPTKVHLIPRPDGEKSNEPPLVLETSQWFSIHQACAYEREDGCVVVYSSGWPATEGGFLTSWSGYAPDFDAIAPTFLWQTIVDPTQRTASHHIAPGMEDCCISHPHTNPNRESLPVRYLYMPYCNRIGESSPPVGYLKLDTYTQEKTIWMGHAQCFAEEPVFVPNPEVEAEDSGWLLGLMYDHQQARSCLAVLDAADIAAGPICRLWFTHHLAHGLHGSWVSEYFGPR
ncbi:MAG: carotenoid oxygenase family protein, partial [Phormidesmis sp.]